MGERTGIEWTHHTWNPWQGCAKVSPGCKFCYMFSDKTRYGQDPRVVVRSSDQTFNQPIASFGPTSTKGTPGDWKWSSGSMVFTCSWSDWFHKGADAWRDDAWAIVRSRPDLFFQILTKRPENVASRLPADWGEGYPNVWLGTSVENQEYADKRIPILAEIPAAVRFLSAEPLLGPIRLPDTPSFDWVIVGGESGPNARPMGPEWARVIRDYCDNHDIPFFFKQWGAFSESGDRVGKKKAGCHLDGLEQKEFPAVLQAGL
jgi:protein gp37